MQPSPGWRTSEFALILLSMVLSALLSLHWITQGEANYATALVNQALPLALSLAAVVGPAVAYLWARFVLKQNPPLPPLSNEPLKIHSPSQGA